MIKENTALQRLFVPMIIAFFGLSFFFISGCNKSDNSPTESTETVQTTDDIADAVSDALASNNGGAIDQVNDLFEIAGGVGVGATADFGKNTADSVNIIRNYDSTNAYWSFLVYKQKSLLPFYYSAWYRVYAHQFRANGRAQKFRITNGVVADTIKHRLFSGSGYFWTPRLVHRLKSISSDWVAANTNTDTVTINGTYSRSSTDTIKAAARNGRVLDQTLSLTFINVKGPRGTRLNRSEKTSGTIQGSYTATVTISGKSPFTITKTFTIILGSGSATFTIDGTRYVADLTTGDH
jgi:hypothetical protein